MAGLKEREQDESLWEIHAGISSGHPKTKWEAGFLPSLAGPSFQSFLLYQPAIQPSSSFSCSWETVNGFQISFHGSVCLSAMFEPLGTRIWE